MIDLKRAMWVYETRQGTSSWARDHTSLAGLRRDTWRCLIEEADNDGIVRLTYTQISAKIAARTNRRPATRSSIATVIRQLRRTALLVADANDVDHDGNRYQLCRAALSQAPERPAPAPRRPAIHPGLAAFDRRAVGWNEAKRRVWRCVWIIMLHSADNDGRVHINLGALTDRASDRLGRDIGDETVARLLRWSSMTGLTTLLHHRQPAVYQIHGIEPAVSAPEASEGHAHL